MAQEKKYETALQYAVKYASMESDPVGRQRAIEFIAYLKNAIKH